jgi:phytol kinase
MTLDPQLPWALGLGTYVMAILFLTRIPYFRMVARGMEPIRAVYYNRKIVHMMAGGVGSLMVPFVFKDPWYPLLCGVLLTLFTYAAHVSGLRMYWFQTADNRNDVKFSFMWWSSISLLWWVLGDPWLAVLPSLYMAFGDGVTGIARNALIRRRSKSMVGSVFMLALCLPMGWIVAGAAQPSIPAWGLASAAVATFVERYEFGPIDDNILITVFASLTLLIGASIARMA